MAFDRGLLFPVEQEDSKKYLFANVVPMSVVKDVVVTAVRDDSLQTLARLSRTCWGMYAVCQPNLTRARDLASQLLDCVIACRYAQAAAILKTSPTSMFVQGLAVDVDGVEIDRSPLHHIVRISHKRMFDVFKDYASEHLETFVQHASAQEEKLDLDLFTRCCDGYHDLHQRWNDDNLSGDEDSEDESQRVIEVWRTQVGGAQRCYLPLHLLQEMLVIGEGEDDRWQLTNHDFDEPLPEKWRISSRKWGEVNPDDPTKVNGCVLGQDFAYYRGPTCFPRMDLTMMDVDYDKQMFIHVLAIRRRQIAEALAVLKEQCQGLPANKRYKVSML